MIHKFNDNSDILNRNSFTFLFSSLYVTTIATGMF